MLWASAALVFLAGYFLLVLLYVSLNLILYPRVSESFSRKKRLEYGEFGPEVFALPWIRQVTKRVGVRLRYDLLISAQDRWCVLVHGAGARPHSMYKHVPYWRKRDYSCAVLHNRGHGESQKTNPSYGVQEQLDLLHILQEIQSAYPSMKEVVFVGESLGAAAILLLQGTLSQKAAINAGGGVPLASLKLRFIADCPFSDLLQQVFHGLRHLPLGRFLGPPLSWGLKGLLWLFGGFRIAEAAPLRMPRGRRWPTLFFHGLRDHYVPYTMSQALFKQWSHSQPGCRLVLVSEAKHAANWRVDPVAYESAVSDWLGAADALERTKA
jgi:pimeloyl-ACP methyl ester carboxylesterase